MIFLRSLHEIYHDIFSLVKLGFSAEYVETISPAERDIFKGYQKMENVAKTRDSNRKAAEDLGLNIEDIL